MINKNKLSDFREKMGKLSCEERCAYFKKYGISGIIGFLIDESSDEDNEQIEFAEAYKVLSEGLIGDVVTEVRSREQELSHRLNAEFNVFIKDID